MRLLTIGSCQLPVAAGNSLSGTGIRLTDDAIAARRPTRPGMPDA